MTAIDDGSRRLWLVLGRSSTFCRYYRWFPELTLVDRRLSSVDWGFAAYPSMIPVAWMCIYLLTGFRGRYE